MALYDPGEWPGREEEEFPQFTPEPVRTQVSLTEIAEWIFFAGIVIISAGMMLLGMAVLA